MLMVLAPSLVADLPFRLMPNLLVAEGAARRSAGLSVVRTILLTLSTLVPLALEQSVFTVIVCTAVTRWGFGLFVLYELSRVYRGVARVTMPLSAGAFWRFALPLGATEAIGLVNQQLDRWLILIALPAERFAEYQVGAWQVPVIGTIAYSVGAAYTPELVRHFQNKEPERALLLWQRGIHKTSLLVVPVTMALVIAAEELVTVLFTEAYRAGASVFRVYSVLTFLRVAAYGSLIVAAGRPHLAMRAAAVGVSANFVFGIALVLTLGFIGPAVAAALAFVVTVATYLYFIGRSVGVPVARVFPFADYLRVLLLAGIAGGAGWFAKHALDLPPALELSIVIAVVLGLFALLGSVTGTIKKSDFVYARDWLRLKIVK
jgi:O-antigen/teichoic acid export membrane protein